MPFSTKECPLQELEFRLRLRHGLELQGLLGDRALREACAARAASLGNQVLSQVETMVSPKQFRAALTLTRGASFADTYRYVAGYGELMTRFLAAPVGLPPDQSGEVAVLGALANLLVSYFDELVDSGCSRAHLLPDWALAISSSLAGRTVLRVLSHVGPAPGRLVRRLVVEYFRRVAALPNARQHAGVRTDLFRMIVKMHQEEGRTAADWRRLRGDPAKQKKTSLPLVVLGLPAWLASANCPLQPYLRHRRWLVKFGLFIRWIDDAADLELDTKAGSANLVLRALERSGNRNEAATALADRISRRGRWLLDEWHTLVEAVAVSESADSAVLATSLVAWLGEPEAGG